MKDSNIYILLQINKRNGEIKMIKDDKMLMKEINKVYKDLKIEKRNANFDSSNNNISKRIGMYDNNKKSYSDNKTSMRMGYECYGKLE